MISVDTRQATAQDSTRTSADSTPTTVISDFSSIDGWEAAPSDGVTLKISLDKGVRGKALRLDVDFHGGGGYAVVRKRVDLDLPENYEFAWQIRGTVPRNNLEFKLVDSSGENVWWSNQRDFEFPKAWEEVTRKKRHIEFAWGPSEGKNGSLAHVRDIEIAITAGSGGKGTVWLDEFVLRTLPAATNAPLTPTARATRESAGHEAMMAIDGDTSTTWRTEGPATLDMDFGERREFGGLTIHWEWGRIPFAADLRTSRDGKNWTTVRRIRANRRVVTPVRLPEHDARYVRLAVLGAASGVRDIVFHPLRWAPTQNDFIARLAKDAPRGAYPRAFTGEQSYWSVVGAPNDSREGLLSADGALEVGKGMFSVEPFVQIDKKVYTWNDVKSKAWLEGGSLPLPGVTWRADRFELRTATFAAGAPGTSRLYATYRLTNTSSDSAKMTLALALRPLQVNPPWQFLQVTGGFAPIRSIVLSEGVARVNGNRIVATVPAAKNAMVVDFDAGDVLGVIEKGVPSGATLARDEEGMASGVFGWKLSLGAGESQEVAVEIPLYEQPATAYTRTLKTLGSIQSMRTTVATQWDSTLSRTKLSLPDTADGRRVAETLRASLGWILVNKDGPGIQPGSRSYERSWIRDGALTSAAMLRLGQSDAVRDFINWFAKFQYANGKVPCCVDQRGADPVPEHDSHGEFIFLVAEYFRQTGDKALVAKLWPNVRRAVMYQDSLRRTRLTEVYQSPDSNHLYGLLPPSISHEGYSAKPMHSYWDDFWALRGFTDAVMLASALGRSDADSLAALRDEFQRDFLASIEKVMAKRHIDYIPGAADLGDYDPTSTSIGLAPGGAMSVLPREALDATFDRYWRESVQRRDGEREWENYTPYELRNVGALLRLGHPDRALAMLDFFFDDQRPPEWREWAEVVWRDPQTPKFVGDIPHTWVASDFIRSALDLFAYERDSDSTLVVGAGVPTAWLTGEGVRLTNLHTHYGTLDLTMRDAGDGPEISWTLQRLPQGGIVLRPPVGMRFRSVRSGENELTVEGDGSVTLREASGRVSVTLTPESGNR